MLVYQRVANKKWRSPTVFASRSTAMSFGGFASPPGLVHLTRHETSSQKVVAFAAGDLKKSGVYHPTVAFLVGGFNHLEKYEFVNGKDDIPYIMENKKCLKPPTRFW